MRVMGPPGLFTMRPAQLRLAPSVIAPAREVAFHVAVSGFTGTKAPDQAEPRLSVLPVAALTAASLTALTVSVKVSVAESVPVMAVSSLPVPLVPAVLFDAGAAG